jgi:hypothetical protein
MYQKQVFDAKAGAQAAVAAQEEQEVGQMHVQTC